MTLKDGRTQNLVGNGELSKLVRNPAAYFIEHNDGLRSTLLMLNGAVKDINFAAKVKGMPSIPSTQFFLSTGKVPYPVARTLIVSRILEAA